MKCEYLFSLLLVFITPLYAKECPHCLHNECDSSGRCLLGCKTGFADKYCGHVCPKTCQQSRCEVGDTGSIVCSLGCLDGYQGPRCNIPCTDGYNICHLSPSNGSSACKTNRYGNQCQHSCEGTCKGFACDDQGTCLSTCTDGRFGEGCSQACGENQQSCKQDGGQCVKCKSGYYGDICEKRCPKCFPVWERNVQRCKPGCTICTEDNTDKSFEATLHAIDNFAWHKLGLICCVGSVILYLLIITTCLLQQRYRAIRKRRSDTYIYDNHKEGELPNKRNQGERNHDDEQENQHTESSQSENERSLLLGVAGPETKETVTKST